MPVSHVPIRVAFDTDYASVGRFLWAFRDLPTTVEIRALSLGLRARVSNEDASAARADVLRVSLTLHAYSRSVPRSHPGLEHGDAMKLGKTHLDASLAMVAASIAYNVWVFTRPATTKSLR